MVVIDIAAIAASRGFIVASRDTSPHEAGGFRVVDPWQS
jgi:toxin FitB